MIFNHNYEGGAMILYPKVDVYNIHKSIKN